MSKPGAELRRIADSIEHEAALTVASGRSLRTREVGRLAREIREQADSIDETIAVLSDPDAMASIEDAEMGL